MRSKGSRFERDLISELWKEGFAAVRVAGSGISTYPCPDIVAGNGEIFIAIEVKMRKSLPLYLSDDEIRQLKDFSIFFGAKPYIALKLPRKKWRFFTIEMLEKTEKNYKIDEMVYGLGLQLEEITGRVEQKRLGEKV